MSLLCRVWAHGCRPDASPGAASTRGYALPGNLPANILRSSFRATCQITKTERLFERTATNATNEHD